jgi:hypothetical protein
MLLQAAGGEPAATGSYHEADDGDGDGELAAGQEGATGRALLEAICRDREYAVQPCPVSNDG